MKPPSFDYVAVSDVASAVEALQAREDSRLLAGGQSLVPLMNMRLARPSLLIDVNPIAGLDHIDRGEATLHLGSMCRHTELESSAVVRDTAPLLSQAAGLVGHVAIRHRGTLGGTIAHADPSAEIPAALVALDAMVHLQGVRGTRSVAAAELFTGYFETQIESTEMVVGVDIPIGRPAAGSAFREFAPRHGDFAVVGIAARVVLADDGTCAHARLVACGVSDRPVDLSDTLGELLGQRDLDDPTARAISASIARHIEPASDVHASAADRVELAQMLAVGSLREALHRSKEDSNP